MNMSLPFSLRSTIWTAIANSARDVRSAHQASVISKAAGNAMTTSVSCVATDGWWDWWAIMGKGGISLIYSWTSAYLTPLCAKARYFEFVNIYINILFAIYLLSWTMYVLFRQRYCSCPCSEPQEFSLSGQSSGQRTPRIEPQICPVSPEWKQDRSVDVSTCTCH